MATKHQFVTIPIDPDFTRQERVAISADVIKFMIKRSKSGRAVNNRGFPPYSKGYFKRGLVDLTLSDTMLKAMRLLATREGELDIGYVDGTRENGKADGNQRGTYGRRSPIPGKARKFLGITQKDLNVILKKHR